MKVISKKSISSLLVILILVNPLINLKAVTSEKELNTPVTTAEESKSQVDSIRIWDPSMGVVYKEGETVEKEQLRKKVIKDFVATGEDKLWNSSEYFQEINIDTSTSSVQPELTIEKNDPQKSEQVKQTLQPMLAPKMTCNDKVIGTKTFKYSCDSKGNVLTVKEMETKSKRVLKETFHNGTQKYGTSDLRPSVKYYFDFFYSAKGELQVAKKIEKARVVEEIFYVSGANFDNRLSKVYYSYSFIYNSDNSINLAKKTYKGKIVTEYYYQAKTMYGGHGAKFFLLFNR